MNFNVWINAFLKPKETFASEKANASLGKGVLYILIGSLIYGIITLIGQLITGIISSDALGMISGLIGAVIITPLIILILDLIFVGVYFVIAKIFGGKGSYTSILYLDSLYTIPQLALMGIFALVPIVGGILNLLLLAYSIYLFYLVIKESQELSSGKAIIVTLIPIVLVILLVVLLAILLGAALLTAIGSASTGYIGLA